MPSNAGRSYVACHRAGHARTSSAHKATELVGRTWLAPWPALAVRRQQSRAIPCPTSRHRYRALLHGRADLSPAHGRDRCRPPSQGGAPAETKRHDCRERLAGFRRPLLPTASRLGGRTKVSAVRHVVLLVVAETALLWLVRLPPFSRVPWPA